MGQVEYHEDAAPSQPLAPQLPPRPRKRIAFLLGVIILAIVGAGSAFLLNNRGASRPLPTDHRLEDFAKTPVVTRASWRSDLVLLPHGTAADWSVAWLRDEADFCNAETRDGFSASRCVKKSDMFPHADRATAVGIPYVTNRGLDVQFAGYVINPSAGGTVTVSRNGQVYPVELMPFPPTARESHLVVYQIEVHVPTEQETWGPVTVTARGPNGSVLDEVTTP